MAQKIKPSPVRAEKLAAYILLCLMTVSLLPVMYLGRYNHPTGDDYYYGAQTRQVWEETGSVRQVLAEAARGTAYQYERWQGSYSAMFLMYLPPNIYGDWAYRLVTPVILLLLTGAVFYLLKPIVCIMLRGTRTLWAILSSLIVLLWTQTVPFQGESFFWYNGSMYYTGYYAVTLIFLGMAVRYGLKPRKRHIPIMVLLAAFLAGGNYVSMLPALLLLCLLEIFLIKEKPECAKGMGAVCLVLLLCFLVNVLAPGNQVRKGGMWSIPAWKAVLKSLFQGIRYIRAWSNVWLVLALMVLTPFLWKTFSNTAFGFRYPLAVAALAYGVFCSMSCPTFYTMNSTGPARVVAIVYYSYLLFFIGVYGYLLGGLYRYLEKRRLSEGNIGGFVAERKRLLKAVALAIGVVLAALQTVSGNLWETTAGKAARLLADGEAAAYEREYQERLTILEDDRIQNVVFQPYEHQPEMLYVGDFDGDPDDETNQKAAQYFHKDSICVQY